MSRRTTWSRKPTHCWSRSCDELTLEFLASHISCDVRSVKEGGRRVSTVGPLFSKKEGTRKLEPIPKIAKNKDGNAPTSLSRVFLFFFCCSARLGGPCLTRGMVFKLFRPRQLRTHFPLDIHHQPPKREKVAVALTQTQPAGMEESSSFLLYCMLLPPSSSKLLATTTALYDSEVA